MWVSIAAAPAVEKVLLAPHERVLWPIVVGIVVFALAGSWLGRRQRGVAGPDAGPDVGSDAGPDAGPKSARDPDDTGAE